MPKTQHNPRETNEPHGVSLQASDVLQQTFAITFRGYDRLDVDSYLEIVAREMERMSSHTITLIDDLRAARQELSLLNKQKENINEALITVQKLTGEVQKKAQTEAERLMQETRDKAREIVIQAQAQMQAQKDEITHMRERGESEAQNCVAAARQEAERIVNEAQEQARALLEDSRSQADAIMDESRTKNTAAQEEADRIRAQAQEQARVLLEDSRSQADAILNEASTKNTAAQEEADRIRAQAAQEAQTIIDKAREDSERRQEDLQRSHTKLQDELAVLTQQKNQFETSFRALIETHLKLMEGNGEQKSD